MQTIQLSTDRLWLQAVTPQTIHHLFTTAGKEEIMTFFATDEAGYIRFQEMHTLGMETHRITLFFFLLINKSTGLPIGECGFHTLNHTHRRTELYYMLRNDADKNHGYMREALPVVLAYGFEMLNLHRIEALVAHDNEPSVRLLKKLGFIKEGTMREDYRVGNTNEDSDCYSLLRWEWDGRKANK